MQAPKKLRETRGAFFGNEYNNGMGKLSNGSTSLVSGYKELQSGISTLNNKMPILQQGTKTIVDKWYGETLGSDEKYNSKVAQGNYFCEAATVSYYSPNAKICNHFYNESIAGYYV